MSVPADSSIEERVINVALRVAPVWTHALGHGLGARVRLHPAANGIYVQREEGALLLRGSDGEQLGALDALPGVQGASYTPLWIEDQTENRILISTTEGQVKAMDSRTLTLLQTLHKGLVPVLAWIDVPLTYQPNVHNQYLILESHSVYRLEAMRGEQELWPYQALRGLLPPMLLHVGDRVVVIDDTSVHFLEEDGSNVDIKNLPSARTGALLRLPGDAGMLMPTANGVQWLHFGKRDQPLLVNDDKALLGVGPGSLLVDGRLLVVAHSDGVEALELANDHFEPRWHVALDAPPLEFGAGQGLVAVSDAKGHITLLGEDAGEVVGRIMHPLPLSGAPLLLGGLLVVSDQDGTIAAYALPHSGAP